MSKNFFSDPMGGFIPPNPPCLCHCDTHKRGWEPHPMTMVDA